MKGIILLFFVTLFLLVHLSDADFQSEVRSYYSRNSQMKSSKSRSGGSVMDENKSDPLKQKENSGSKGSSLSAWGIVGVIVATILLATSGYYAFVFYPFLCKKERNYDMIELGNVV